MKLIVVIPALNEALTVGRVIEQIPRDLPQIGDTEVIVVDDGSADNTSAVARRAGAHVVCLPTNQGNGAAVLIGVRAALSRGADIIVTIDADGQFNPADIAELVQPLLNGTAEFVTCSRFARKDRIPQMPRVKRWGNSAVTAITNFIAGTHITDSSCGFRAYTRDTALKMNVYSTFDYAQEALITLAAHGVRIDEISLPVRGVREFGKSRIAHNLFRFAGKCLSTLLRTMRDFRPLLFFGSIGALFFAVGMFLGGWVLVHWSLTGETSPYTSFLTGSAVGLLMGVLLFVLALVADLLGRTRLILEELLYLAKRGHYADAGCELTSASGRSGNGQMGFEYQSRLLHEPEAAEALETSL
jgi:glycosyltransferase involved in cell wall biosynthesis